DGPPLEQLEFERIVEAGGIADVLLEQAEPLTDADALANFAFAGAQPAAIADDGVDFAVVGDISEGLRKLPRRFRVRGITLVENRKMGNEFRAAQVFIKVRKLPRRQQAFVDDGA